MSALGTFFGWRGSRHGKVTSRKLSAQTDYMRARDRGQWRREHPGEPYPRELWTDAERRADLYWWLYRPDLTLATPWVWWTLAVLGVLCGLTIVGLPITVILAIVLAARNPWRGDPVMHPEPAVEIAEDPPTTPIALAAEVREVTR